VQAIVLAAGVGTRLFPLTSGTPKALLPIANTPLIDYVVDSIQKVGIKDIIVVTGYMSSTTVEYLEDPEKRFKAEIRFVNANRYKEGPLYSLLAAERLVKDQFLLIPADLILDHRILSKLLANSRNKDIVYIATSRRSLRTQRTLVLCYNRSANDNSTILRFWQPGSMSEKWQGDTRTQPSATVGAIICPSRLFEYIHLVAEKGSRRVIDALSEYASRTGLAGCVAVNSQHYWFDVDTIDDMLEANSYILKRRLAISENKGHLYLEHETSVKVGVKMNSRQAETARVLGPVLVGEGCTLGENSIIGPYVSIQGNCVIGKYAKISNAIILGGSVVDNSARIDAAVVRGKEILRAGTSRGVKNE